jgi:Kdo2-lipid IVA lauroyltransferase/acyltransferase
MPRKQSPPLNYLVYLATRGAVCLFQMVSNATARTIVVGLAWLAFTMDRRHRLIALDNLRKAFPARYSETQLNELVFATYTHLFTLLVEMSQLPRKMHRHNANTYFDLGPRAEDILALLRSDRPVLIVTGHFGNWELAGYGLGAMGLRTYAVARPLDNPYLEAFLRRFRGHTGQTMLAKKNIDQIHEALSGGGKVAVLADQGAGPRGLHINFFGRPASTHKGVAVLALQHHAALLVVGVRKIGEPMRYQVVVEDIIFPEEYTGSRAQIVRQITQRYTVGLERVIRSAPEQYFWLHNRWKQHGLGSIPLAKAA